jgi:Domain of unknown function (DUF5916)
MPTSIRDPAAASRSRPLGAAVGLLGLLASPARAAPGRDPTPPPPPALDGPAAPAPPEVVSRDARGRVSVRATRLAEPLRIDGLLDEGVYRAVRSISGFVQQEPREGEPATEPTEVWVLVDDRTLYVSARCWDSQPGRMVANDMRRDVGTSRNESFAVLLDTFHDRRSGFLFETNLLGALHDAQVADEQSVNSDWNTVWEVETARFADGWTVEMAIPFKSLRYAQGGPQLWGVNFRRTVRWKNERSTLTPMLVEHDITRSASAAALVGIDLPPASRNLELKPYVVSGLSTNRATQPPVTDDFTADFGLTAKVGLSRALTADLTYNTDFAQVEADDQQVNLTRFSLFYPEKREFFLEGQGNFDFGGASQQSPLFHSSNTPVVFFSRRIGLSEGMAVPIVGGARVTGKAGKYGLGALSLRTGRRESAGAAETDFSVLRVRRDVLARSTIGVIATRRSPSLEGRGSNLVYGFDASLGFFENLRLAGYYARSRTPGVTEDDASYRAQFDYDSDVFELKLERLAVGGGFRPEIGFLRREDFRQSFGYLRFSPRPGSVEAVRKWGGVASFDRITDNRGRLETRQAFFEAFIDWSSGDTWDAHYTLGLEQLTEGFEVARGVVIPPGRYRAGEIVTNYGFGPQRKVPCSIGFVRGGFFGGTHTGLSYTGRLKLGYRLLVEPRLSWDRVRLPRGDFDSRLVSTRLTWSFSPRVFASALVQYNSSNRTLSTNARLRWEYRAGSELFVVVSDNRDTGARGLRGLRDRTVVLKLTRLLRF